MHARLIVPLLLVAFGGGLAVGQTRGPAKPRMWADVLLDLVTDTIPSKTRVHTNLDHWEPGGETGRHQHPGPTLIIVLEGELSEWVLGGQANTLIAGHAYWRAADQEHNVRNLSGKLARALAVHLDPAR
jgi:quercetin dioxygenase-like cupin family protein